MEAAILTVQAMKMFAWLPLKLSFDLEEVSVICVSVQLGVKRIRNNSMFMEILYISPIAADNM